MWDLAKEWERLWEDWKVGTFTELQTSEMETHSITLYKKLNKYSRELKVRSNIIIICFRPFWHFSSVNYYMLNVCICLHTIFKRGTNRCIDSFVPFYLQDKAKTRVKK